MTTPTLIPLRQPVCRPPDDAPAFTVAGLHHFAWRCRNADETRRFYEGLLGLPLAAVVQHDHVPSTGAFQPYFHIFFEMGDGSYLAFFDLLDETGATADPNTPTWVNHMALEVASEAELVAAKTRLHAANVEVLGIVDHQWFKSIYFFDPNGIRLELVHRTASLDEMRGKADKAPSALGQRALKLIQSHGQGA